MAEALRKLAGALDRRVPVLRHTVDHRVAGGGCEARAVYAAAGLVVRAECRFFKTWRCRIEASDGTLCEGGACRGPSARLLAEALREAGVPDSFGETWWEAEEP
ncbi:hypothetical protein [Pyrodictium abyssi]|uniref:Uncharacterized protein n=1 Tax=Pyrodictium abyssi TaxID=54256 RepID=A0ABM8IYG5_9CREN|nr:hypothetical protein PABY_21530 [Pyrodictium abyssi]